MGMGTSGGVIVERKLSVSGEATVVAAARAVSPLVEYPSLVEKDKYSARTV